MSIIAQPSNPVEFPEDPDQADRWPLRFTDADIPAEPELTELPFVRGPRLMLAGAFRERAARERLRGDSLGDYIATWLDEQAEDAEFLAANTVTELRDRREVWTFHTEGGAA